ncbi:hypothetical protein GCM10008924_06850 [Gracilibacillus halotolerans]
MLYFDTNLDTANGIPTVDMLRNIVYGPYAYPYKVIPVSPTKLVKGITYIIPRNLDKKLATVSSKVPLKKFDFAINSPFSYHCHVFILSFL